MALLFLYTRELETKKCMLKVCQAVHISLMWVTLSIDYKQKVFKHVSLIVTFELVQRDQAVMQH